MNLEGLDVRCQVLDLAAADDWEDIGSFLVQLLLVLSELGMS